MNQAIQYLTQRLNEQLKLRFGLSEDVVIAGRLINSNGSVPEENQGKVIFSIVNVTSEANRQFYGQKVGFANAGKQETPPLLLNVELLLTANCSDELESAKFLAAGIQFFHECPFFTAETNPSFPAELEKVTVEICNLSLPELDALWSAVGTPMIPSAMYRMRILQTNS